MRCEESLRELAGDASLLEARLLGEFEGWLLEELEDGRPWV